MKEPVRPSESPSEALNRIVAEQEEPHPSALGRLTCVVDVNDLDRLVEPPIEFSYCG